MTPAEAAAAIDAMRVRVEAHYSGVPRSVQLRQAFEAAAEWPRSLELTAPPVYVAPAPGIDMVIRQRLNAIERAARSAKRKAQRRARRITRLHQKR